MEIHPALLYENGDYVKVRELIASLNNLDQDLDVICYADDLNVLSSGAESAFFHVDRVESASGKMFRDDHGRARLKFGQSEFASTIALVTVLADF